VTKKVVGVFVRFRAPLHPFDFQPILKEGEQEKTNLLTYKPHEFVSVIF
jgi:hypothetical protein